MTLSVATRDAVTRRALDAFSGKGRGAKLSSRSTRCTWVLRDWKWSNFVLVPVPIAIIACVR